MALVILRETCAYSGAVPCKAFKYAGLHYCCINCNAAVKFFIVFNTRHCWWMWYLCQTSMTILGSVARTVARLTIPEQKCRIEHPPGSTASIPLEQSTDGLLRRELGSSWKDGFDLRNHQPDITVQSRIIGYEIS